MSVEKVETDTRHQLDSGNGWVEGLWVWSGGKDSDTQSNRKDLP